MGVLQDVHVIGDNGLPFALLGKVCIPTGPGRFFTGSRESSLCRETMFFVGKDFRRAASSAEVRQ